MPIDAGADWAEIDVQETKDGKLILLHDDSLKRTAGVNKKVWEMTLAQIRKAGRRLQFSPEIPGRKNPDSGGGLKILQRKTGLKYRD